LELWLHVEDAGGVHDVAVDAEPEHTVGALVEAVAGHVGSSVEGPATLLRTGLALTPDTTIAGSGLRSGDTIVLGAGGARGTGAPAGHVRLVVAGGPAAGQVVNLRQGTTTVGRSSRAGIKIDDPALSRTHLEVRVDNDAVTIVDAGSSNGTYLHGVKLEAPTPFAPGQILEAGDSVLRIEIGEEKSSPAVVRDGLVQFTRPPRVKEPNEAPAEELSAPPDAVQKRKIPLATALLPLVAAPIMVAGTGNSSYLVMAALSPVMAAASVLEDRRSGGKEHQEKLARFYAELAEISDRMAERRRAEVGERWEEHPDPADLLRRVRGPAPDLWERRRTDQDFLKLRVGWADQASRATWTMRDGGEPEKRIEAEAELDQHKVAPAVPVVIDLVANPVVGLAGDAARVEETARWLVAQAAVLHSPRDVTVAVAVAAPRVEAWRWTTWLPHCRADAAPMSAHPFAAGDEEARVLVAGLNDLVQSRREQAQGRLDQTAAFAPSVVLVLDEDLQIPRSAVATLLEEGPACGLKVIWLGDTVEGLPGETGSIVFGKDVAVTVTNVLTGDQVRDGRPDRCPEPVVDEISWRLAGVRDATARGRSGGDLPSFVALPDLLGGEPTPEAFIARWEQSRGDLGAPIGVAETGPFSIDIRKDGPHALLGGTTGAGKSELLQTYVAALAATHPPTRLTFLLVDYKGGAAFKDCVKLPHTVGVVTDLDGHLVHRALVSLNAELHRRERLLGSVGAKDLVEMERKAPEQAPATLMLIVDEFATLAKELPEFVDGVVNVAQRGRSLGIHMLLATQRPAGAINDNIRANTNLRMALRMNDEADSEDVIGAKHAAALPRSLPGRAFARLGSSELVEVQVAYAGGHTLAGGDDRPLVVSPLKLGRVERRVVKRNVEHDTRPTDLQAVVQVAIDANERLGLPRQPAPWLPALPEVLRLDDLAPSGDAETVTIGLLDAPAQQAQVPYSFDLETDGSLLVFGSSGAGKTTILRTIAVALARQHRPDELYLYGLDFASRGLGSLEALPHCGAVVGGDDVERVQRVFSMLDRWIAERKQRFAETGATSLAELQRATAAAGGPPVPRVVVLLDSYGGFSSVFEKIDYGARLEAFPQLVSEGRPLGIHFVITADRRNAMPLALTSTVQTKLVLRLADVDDYGVLGLDGRAAREATLPPGRGFQANTLEVQCAIVGADPAGEAQTAAVLAEGSELRHRHGDGIAPSIGTLPAEVALAPLVALSTSLRPVIGIGERELEPVAVDLAEGHFLVTGPNRSGKSTALAAVARGLRAADPDLELHLLAPRRTPLTSLDVWTSVARGSEAIDDLCTDLKDRVDERDLGDPPLVIVLDDGNELADSMADTNLESIIRRGRDVDVWVVGASEVAAAHRSYGGWLPELRKERQGLLLQPDPDIDGDLLGVRLPKARTTLPGRGILVNRYGLEMVQVGA
jgi:DNA segregation ATPase FtsK/SpoIIIE, S-DNA-T family